MSVSPIFLALLAYVVVGVQGGIAAHLRLAGAAPNLGLAVAACLALRLAPRQALLACVGLGLLQDLATQQPFGAFGLTYGVVAIAGNRLGRLLQRQHPLSLTLLTALGGLLWLVLVLLHDLHHPPGGLAPTGPTIRTPLAPLAIATFWTMLVALPLAWLIDRALPLGGGWPRRSWSARAMRF